MAYLKDAVDEVYREKQSFIVIGLTGRTGSGCTTTCNLLTNEFFSDFNPPKPKCNDFRNDEERKYAITYEYLKHNWKQFQCVQMTDVLTSFILQKTFDEFLNFIATEFKQNIDGKLDALKVSYESAYAEVKTVEAEHCKLLEGNLSQDEFFGHPVLTNLIFSKLRIIKDEIKMALETISNSLYTEIYQKVGNNVRKSGDAFNDTFDPKKIFELPRRANLVIKVYKQQKSENKSCADEKSTLLIIDALRNPYEIAFFRDRYSAFFLFAVKTDDQCRKERLVEQKSLSGNEIENLDSMEYSGDMENEDHFTHLNLKQCISVADIHLTNSGRNVLDVSELKTQLVRYLSLILHPGLVTPSVDERLMHIAYSAKMNSGCISRQVGAVVADSNYSVVSVGWNTTPDGQVPCVLRNVISLQGKHDKEAFSDYEFKDSEFNDGVNEKFGKVDLDSFKGKNVSFCFKDVKNKYCGKRNEKNQVHTRSIHAEEYAFLDYAKRGGIGLKGGKLYVTASPCELCSKKSYHLGIVEIVYIEPYPGIAESHILNSGNQRPKVKLFYGVTGRAYAKLYEQIMPYKDELDLILGASRSKI